MGKLSAFEPIIKRPIARPMFNMNTISNHAEKEINSQENESETTDFKEKRTSKKNKKPSVTESTTYKKANNHLVVAEDKGKILTVQVMQKTQFRQCKDFL